MENVNSKVATNAVENKITNEVIFRMVNNIYLEVDDSNEKAYAYELIMDAIHYGSAKMYDVCAIYSEGILEISCKYFNEMNCKFDLNLFSVYAHFYEEDDDDVDCPISSGDIDWFDNITIYINNLINISTLYSDNLNIKSIA